MTENPSTWISRADQDGEKRISTVATVSLDPDGTIRFVNDAWTALTGYDSAAISGEQFASVVVDEQADQIDAVFETIDPEQSIGCDLTIRRDDGLSVPVGLTGQVESDPDGTIERIHCQVKPQSGPELSGGTLAEQNALLRTLLDGLPVGILAETASRTVLTVNNELLSMFEVPGDRGDVVGTDCARLAAAISDDFVDSDGFVAGIEGRIDDGEPVLGEQLERTDGRVFERSYLPIELPTGSGHLWMYEDVTSEVARKTELETYKRLVDVAPVGVFRTTTDGRVLTANKQLADIIGFEDEADLLDNYDDLASELYVDPDRRQTFLDRLQRHGVVRDFEYEARGKEGGRRWLSMNARVLDETDDGARVITGFTWDTTDRKRHEQQLAVLGRVLRHNLRNALTVIEGQADILASGQSDSAVEARQTISDRAETLLKLADKERAIVDLLRGAPETVTRDLCAITQAVQQSLQDEYPEATIALSCSDSSPVAVCLRFEQAIRELIENAIVHAESDTPTVSLSIRLDDDTAEIEVRDTGPRIPEVERQVLRGQTDESPLYHSAGIGLFLVRQAVHCSNGALYFEENDPQGNVVRIRLPRA